MHEYSLVRALLDRVDAEARTHGAVAVARLTVRLGELSGVEIELFRSAFDMCRGDSICADAELAIVPVAPRWVCPGCGSRIEAGSLLRCGECGVPARLAAGDELILERIEMEVE
jgi:hydrogenase nickel incorporation protein HypA/HybF